MMVVPLRYDTARVCRDIAFLSDAAKRLPEIQEDVADLFEHRRPLFRLVEQAGDGAEGVTVRLEPTERLSRVVRKAHRLSLRVISPSEGAAP